MAAANAGFVDRFVEAWNRRDVDAILALFDPECEVVFPPEVPEPGPFHGHAELSQWAEGFLAAWEFHNYVPGSVFTDRAEWVLGDIERLES